MKKRVLIILAAAICVAAALAVFLPGRGIDFATNRALREQLAAQNASDALSLHRHVYRAAKAAGEEGTRCPYGGTVQYQTTIGGQTAQVSITCLDFDNSLYYILEQLETDPDGGSSAAGDSPYTDDLAAALDSAKTAVTSGAATSVKKAGGYAQIISILCSGQLTSTISGWTGHPYIHLDDPSAIDVRIVSFEEHDPFA